MLPPDERVHHVFSAIGGPTWLPLTVAAGIVTYLAFLRSAGYGLALLALIMLVGRLVNPRYLCAVTDRSIVLMRGGLLVPSRPARIVGQLPRATRIGPISRGMNPRLTTLGVPVRINRSAAAAIDAADRDAGFLPDRSGGPGFTPSGST